MEAVRCTAEGRTSQAVSEFSIMCACRRSGAPPASRCSRLMRRYAAWMSVPVPQA